MSDIDPALEKLLEELPDLPPDAAPSQGWQARVLAELGDAPVPIRRRTRAWPIAGALVAAAAALVIFFALRGRAPSGAGEDLALEVIPGATHRGTSASVGDTLALRAPDLPDATLRIYGSAGTVVKECRGAKCALSFTLATVGHLDAVLFTGAVEPARTLDEDLANADRAGIRVVHRTIDVR